MSNIKIETDAYKQGERDAEKWISTEGNKIPVWNVDPVTPEDRYYRIGFKAKFKELTKIDPDEINRKAKKNYRLETGRNGKRRPNSLDREIKSKGADFINKYGDRAQQELKNLAERVLRDMSNKNVNVPDYEEYFVNNLFLQALIGVAQNNAYYHQIMEDSIRVYFSAAENNLFNLNQSNIDNLKQRFLVYHHSNNEIYSTLYYALIKFKEYLDNGVFNPEPIHIAETNLFNKHYNITARNPYATGYAFPNS